MQIPTDCRVGLPHFPSDSAKTQPYISSYFHSCANILADIFTDALESTDGLSTTELLKWAGGRDPW